MTQSEEHEQDDGRDWGYMGSGGVCSRLYPGSCGPCFCRPLCSHDLGYDPTWFSLPKLPLLRAGLGPPPFDVTLPSGEVRHIIHNPAETPNG